MLLLVACGTPEHDADRQFATTPAPSAAAARGLSNLDRIEAGNKNAANVEAHRLAAGIAFPKGTTPGQPFADLEPAGSAPASAVMSATRWLDVPLPQHDTLAWVTAHVSTSLRKDGSDGPILDLPISGLSYADDAPSTSYEYATLDIETLATSKSSTLVLVKGAAVWLDPHPLLDSGVGQRISITVSSGCPKSDGGFNGVLNRLAPTDSLLPIAPPISGLVCTYYGSNGKPFSLAKSRPLSSEDAIIMANKINALGLAHDNAQYTGGYDDGSADVVVFHYESGPDAPLWVKTGGHTPIANGKVLKEFVDLPALGLPWNPSQP